MKVKRLSDFDANELDGYKRSKLYLENVLSHYQYTDKCLQYYSDYYNEEYKDHSLVVIDSDKKPAMVLYAYSKASVFSHFGSPVSVVEGQFPDFTQKNEAYKMLLTGLNELFTKNNYEEFHFYSNDFLNAEYFGKLSAINI